MSVATLLKGGWVLSLDPKVGNLAAADVLIEDGKITEVGPGLRRRDAELVDATDCIVMPGFVDTHRHVWKSLFRNVGVPGPGVEPAVTPALYGPHYDSEDVYAATLIGLLGAVEAGITTVVDWSDIHLDDRHFEAALQAHADAGLRTVFACAAAPWAERDQGLGLRRLAAALPAAVSAGSSTTVAIGLDAPGRTDLDRVAADWAAALENGLRIHAHAGVEESDHGVVAELSGRGLLGDDVTLVHCSKVDDDDLAAIAASRASVSLTPASDMAGGLGSPPLQRLIDTGIRPGLGIDTEGTAPGDMFAQMRAVISLQHATYFDRKLAGKAGLPNLLTTREVIRYGTVYGARVAGLGEVTGSLTPGRQADVVVLRADRPNIWPINDPIGAVVWGMDTSNVDWVLAGGRVLMRHGVLEGDVDRARGLAITAQQRVASSAGLLSGTVAGGAG